MFILSYLKFFPYRIGFIIISQFNELQNHIPNVVFDTKLLARSEEKSQNYAKKLNQNYNFQMRALIFLANFEYEREKVKELLK